MWEVKRPLLAIEEEGMRAMTASSPAEARLKKIGEKPKGIDWTVRKWGSPKLLQYAK